MTKPHLIAIWYLLAVAVSWFVPIVLIFVPLGFLLDHPTANIVVDAIRQSILPTFFVSASYLAAWAKDYFMLGEGLGLVVIVYLARCFLAASTGVGSLLDYRRYPKWLWAWYLIAVLDLVSVWRGLELEIATGAYHHVELRSGLIISQLLTPESASLYGFFVQNRKTEMIPAINDFARAY